MPTEPLQPAVTDQVFSVLCAATRSEIDRVFSAHGVTLPSIQTPIPKRTSSDAYCKVFRLGKEEAVLAISRHR